MKKFIAVFIAATLLVMLPGCRQPQSIQIAATTSVVYDFTSALCKGTDLNVAKVITESVSCLHDYTLQIDQMQTIENASLTVISGAGMEDFMHDTLSSARSVIDASRGIKSICGHGHSHDDLHHDTDPHIWLSPENAQIMVTNIYNGLIEHYPEKKNIIERNLKKILAEFDALNTYADNQLKDLSCREIITFHDGFAYMAEAFDLEILKVIEEESGSEASAAELVELIKLVNDHSLTCIFTEVNGSTSAANIISDETGATIFTLDMAMGEKGYFEAMYYNIDVLKEALE